MLVMGFCVQAGYAAGPEKDTLWKTDGSIGLKLTQVNFTNWANGGENSFAFDLQGFYEADYKKDKHLWQNRLELGYGLSRLAKQNARKANDKIYLNSNYGYELSKNLYVSGLVNFQTQFAPGYNYDGDAPEMVARFMSPAYLTVGAGITWTQAPYFTLTFSPVTWRETFVLDDYFASQGSFGVTPGKHTLAEFGAMLRMEVQYEFLKNMTVYSRVECYSDYLRKPQNVDVNWEVQLNMQINKWFAATFTTNLVYDDDVKILKKNGKKSPGVQFKEVLGVGVQFSF